MSLLTASNLAKSFGPLDVFSEVSLGVPQRARIGLVGPNGIGKTSLLLILAGLDVPSEGTVHPARNMQREYLPQEADVYAEHSLWEECRTAFYALQAKEAELARLEQAMGDPERRAEALEKYGPAQEAFERQGGYTYQTRIRQTLSGLGFKVPEFERPLHMLSGGQRTRALLARLLLSDPDLLILDEPTNHLDIAAVEWLENYLRDWQGGAIIVSHDRYFLDRVINTVWEMSALGFETYRGNYSAYLQQRRARWDRRTQIFEAEIARLENEMEYIRRNIAGQRTTQARGKLRRLSRQVEAIEKGGLLAMTGKPWGEISEALSVSGRTMRVEEADRRLKALRAPRMELPDLKLNIKASQRSGDLVLRTKDLAIGYPDVNQPLFEVPDLIFRRRECAAVIGPNGAGKTTFLKTLLGQVEPFGGEILLGASLQVGYFAQAHEELNPERTLIAEIESVAPNMLVAHIRDYLARFQFSGDAVFKLVEVLSGGERGRLALAKLALTSANLLLLDEPTNHLDIPSQEILQAVLAEYEGTILLVSHDRYLIDALGTQIWEIHPTEVSLTVFEGTYTAYRAQNELQGKSAGAKAVFRAPRPSRRSPNAVKDRRRQQRLAEVESEIQELEVQLQELGRKLETPPADLGEVERLGATYHEVHQSLETLIEEWEQLHD